MADLRKQLERQMIVSRVQQNEVLGKIGVSDEEARRYYESHVGEFTSTQAVTLREIFVSVPGDGATLNVGRDEEAREKATKIRERAACRRELREARRRPVRCAVPRQCRPDRPAEPR